MEPLYRFVEANLDAMIGFNFVMRLKMMEAAIDFFQLKKSVYVGARTMIGLATPHQFHWQGVDYEVLVYNKHIVLHCYSLTDLFDRTSMDSDYSQFSKFCINRINHELARIKIAGTCTLASPAPLQERNFYNFVINYT